MRRPPGSENVSGAEKQGASAAELAEGALSPPGGPNHETGPKHAARTVILVDASNVAHGRTSGVSVPTVENLRQVLDRLRRYPVRVVALADATLRHKIDQQAELEAKFKSGELEQVPAGTSADDFLWQLWKSYTAKGIPAFIVTNDQFPLSKARAESRPENPRIAFLFLGPELIFQPPLETLLSTAASPAPAVESLTSPHPPNQDKVPAASVQPPVRSTGSAPPAGHHIEGTLSRSSTELVDGAIEVIAALTEPTGGAVRRLNFATVAHELHQKFGGDFATRFGLVRPKELAEELAKRGLVTISYTNTTMYVEPTLVFEGRIIGRRLPRRQVAQSRAPEGEAKVPAGAPHVATEPGKSEHALPEVIEVSAGAPAPIVEIGDPETFLKLARDHHALHIFHWPSGVYSSEYRSPFRSGGEFFFTSNGTSFRLWGRAYKTVEDFVDASRHGFHGSDHQCMRVDSFGNEMAPAIHRELQELVDPHRDGYVPQEGDVYYCARAAGFDDFATFFADRKRKSKEDQGFRYA